MWRKVTVVALLAGLSGWAWAVPPNADVVNPELKGAQKPKVVLPSGKVTPAPIKTQTAPRNPLQTAREAGKAVPVLEPEPRTPQANPNPADTLHYDGPNANNAVGLTNGGTFEGAARFTPTELGPYTGWAIVEVIFYHFETGTHSGQVKIYGQGTPTEPGALITSEPYTATGQGWVSIPLTTPVLITGSEDLWVSVEITHAAGEFPYGVDAGPAVPGKGDWVYSAGAGIPWSELRDFGIDVNWNVRAIVEPYQLPEHDIRTVQILSPTGVYPIGDTLSPEARYQNTGTNPETFDAIFEIHDQTDALVYIDTVMGVSADSGEVVDVSFTDFIPPATGWYTAIAYHDLVDSIPGNDTVSATFFVYDTAGPQLPPPSMGPDPCGYVASSSQDFPGHPALEFQWIDPTAGTPISLGDDDYATVNLSFPFPFYGQTLTSINICSNGFLEFPSTYTGFSNQPLPFSSISNFIGNWDDYNPSAGGQVYFYDAGAFAVIAWVNVPHFGASTPNTFEIILYPTGVIKFQFLSMDPTYVNSSTLGIQKGDGSEGCYLQYVYNGNPPEHTVEDSLVVMFWEQHLDHDVGVTDILEPAGVLFLGDVATPTVNVRNFGANDETFDVEFKIYDVNNNEVYSSTYTGLSLPAGAETTITFAPDWSPADTGQYTTVSYTMLAGDEEPANDTAYGTVIVLDTTGAVLPPPSMGPDPCGYVASSSQDFPGHPALEFQWIDPTAGTPISLGDDDYATVNLSFPFPFYGQTLTSINICSNGFLEFPSTYTGFSNQPLPFSSISNFIGNWDDYNPLAGGQVYFYDAGAFAVIAWVDVPHFGASTPNTFEIILYPTGVIKFQFLSMDPTYVNSSTLGIQKGDGSEGCYLQYVYNGNPPEHTVEDSLVVMFWYQPMNHDVGVIDISPQGSIPVTTYDVEVTVQNFGQNDETFDLSAVIVDTTTGDTVFSATQNVSLAAMSIQTFNMGTWTPDSNAYYEITAWTELAGDERPQNDTMTVEARTALGLGDMVFFTDVETQVGNNRILGVEFDGEHFYVTGAGPSASPPHMVYELDIYGNYTGNSWQQPTTQSWGWRDLAYDGLNEWDIPDSGHFYGSDDPIVDEWHIEAGALMVDNMFNGPENPNRALAYNPENDHFYTANFSSSLYEFDRTGFVWNTWPNTFAMYGAAYDPGPMGQNTPYIWWASQDNNQWGQANLIHQWDITTMSFTGVQIHPQLPGGYTDQTAGGLCFWRDYFGMSTLFEIVQGTPTDYMVGFFVRPASATRIPVAVQERTGAKPLVFALKPVQPNPTGGLARIAFTIPKKGEVNLKVYDATGRLVRTLQSGVMNPGHYTVTWNGTDDHGRKVSAGVYFLKLEQGSKRATQRLVLMR